MYLEKPYFLTGNDIVVGLLLRPVETLKLEQGQEDLKRWGYDRLGDIVFERDTRRLSNVVGLWKRLEDRGLHYKMELDPELAARYRRAKQALGLFLAELKLSVRATNALEVENITSVLALAQRTESQLLKIRNVGETCVREIVAKLADHGLRLDMDLTMPETPSE